MRIIQSLLILASLTVAACVGQAQIQESRVDGIPERMSSQPREALNIRITSRLDLGLFTLPAPEASGAIPELSLDLADPAQVKILVSSIGCGVGFHWMF